MLKSFSSLKSCCDGAWWPTCCNVVWWQISKLPVFLSGNLKCYGLLYQREIHIPFRSNRIKLDFQKNVSFYTLKNFLMQLDDLKIALLWKFLNVLQEIENISRQDIYSKRTILSGQYRRHLLYSWLMTCTAPHYLQTHIFHQGNHLFHIFYLHCFLIYFIHRAA